MANGTTKPDAEFGGGEKVEVRFVTSNGSDLREGGVRGCIIVLASFLCNGIIFSVINSVGTICDKVRDILVAAGDSEASAKSSLVGSLAIGMTFLTSAVAGVLTDQLGIRTTALIGAFLAGGGMLASSFFYESVGALYFTFGIMYGVGASLVYTPSLVVLGQYFHKYLGVVNGFVTAGSSVFTLAMPHIMAAIIKSTNLKGLFLFLTALACIMIGCTLAFKPVVISSEPKNRKDIGKPKNGLKQIINTDLFRCRRYVVWTIAMPIALLGYFVPYVHTVTFISATLPEQDGNMLITYIAAMSLISRLLCGPISDLPRVNTVVLQQASFAMLGILTGLLVVFKSWPLLVMCALGMGICDGFSVALIGPIAFELCGKEGATQAIGFLLGISSIPMTVGPFLAGFIYDQTNSHTLSYVLSGALTFSGAVIMMFMHCMRKDAVGGSVLNSPDAIEFEAMKPMYAETTIPDTRPLPPSYKDVLLAKTQNGTVHQDKTT